MRVDNDKRSCAGGCGERVHRKYLACRNCYARLPESLRRAIMQARGRIAAWRRAYSEAERWYADSADDGSDGSIGDLSSSPTVAEPVADAPVGQTQPAPVGAPDLITIARLHRDRGADGHGVQRWSIGAHDRQPTDFSVATIGPPDEEDVSLEGLRQSLLALAAAMA